jgi:hypothetical protein
MNYKTILLCVVIGASMQNAWGMDEKTKYDKQTVRLEYWIPHDPAKRAQILSEHDTAAALETCIDTMLSEIALTSAQRAKEKLHLEDEGIIEGGLPKQSSNNNEWSFFYENK